MPKKKKAPPALGNESGKQEEEKEEEKEEQEPPRVPSAASIPGGPTPVYLQHRFPFLMRRGLSWRVLQRCARVLVLKVKAKAKKNK